MPNSGVLCLDTSVLVKVLVPEEGSSEADALLRRAVTTGCRLIAPAFMWVEAGTVLRKKLRMGLITEAEANFAWERFTSVAIDYLQDAEIPRMAWRIASRFQLPTVYDAAFLAVCESVAGEPGVTVEFWTADHQLVRALGASAPEYVHLLKPAPKEPAG